MTPSGLSEATWSQGNEQSTTSASENRESTTGAEKQIFVDRAYWGEEAFEQAKEIEYEVFRRKNFAKERTTGKGMGEYEDYDFMSTFIVARNAKGEMLGVLREITNDFDSWEEVEEAMSHDPELATSGFKTLDDFDLYDGEVQPEKDNKGRELPPETYVSDAKQHIWHELAPKDILEIGTISIPHDKETGRRGTIAAVYRELYKDAARDGRTTLIASIDRPYFLSLRRQVGFKQMGPTIQDYMGSSTTPAILDIEESWAYVQTHNPIFYHMINEDNEAA